MYHKDVTEKKFEQEIKKYVEDMKSYEDRVSNEFRKQREVFMQMEDKYKTQYDQAADGYEARLLQLETRMQLILKEKSGQGNHKK